MMKELIITILVVLGAAIFCGLLITYLTDVLERHIGK